MVLAPAAKPCVERRLVEDAVSGIVRKLVSVSPIYNCLLCRAKKLDSVE